MYGSHFAQQLECTIYLKTKSIANKVGSSEDDAVFFEKAFYQQVHHLLIGKTIMYIIQSEQSQHVKTLLNDANVINVAHL